MKKKIYYPHHPNMKEKNCGTFPKHFLCAVFCFYVRINFYGDAFTSTVLYVDRLSFIMDADDHHYFHIIHIGVGIYVSFETLMEI